MQKKKPSLQLEVRESPNRRRTAAGVLLIIVATYVAYLPSLHGGFILDDHLLLTDNQLIKAADGLYRFWFTTEPIDYWPVSNSSLWLEWRLWGMNPTGYHVTNVALHVVAALLIWANMALLSIPGGFVAALLFALHPVNVESVAWIAQRKDVLALVFLLFAVFCHVRAESTPSPQQGPAPLMTRWHWVSLAAFVLAMLSKASVAVLPLLLVALTWWRRPLTRTDAKRALLFLLIAAALILVNGWFQARFTHAIVRGSAERVLGAATVIWFYLSKALLPVNLSFVYPKWQIRPDQLRWWIPLLAAVIVSGVLWAYRRTWGRPWLLAWMLFCISLAPVMGFTDVGFMEHSLVADHYQHLALVAVIAIVAAGWGVWQRRARGSAGWLPMLAVVGVAGTLAVLTWRQNRLYTDGETLFRATLEQNPSSAFAHNNLGLVLLDSGRSAEGLEEFAAAVQLKPDDAGMHYNLGRTLVAVDRVDEGIDHLQQALQLKPLELYNHDLATALVKAHRLPEAIVQFTLAVRLQPDSPEAENNLGAVLSEAGRSSEALQHFDRALQLEPDFQAAHSNVGRALLQANQLEPAIAHFEQAVRLNPDSPATHNDLGVALSTAGRLEAAIEQFRRTLEIDPSDATARANLEETLTMQRNRARHES
jgi:tetratricopeptide (TPR) repeat protein